MQESLLLFKTILVFKNIKNLSFYGIFFILIKLELPLVLFYERDPVPEQEGCAQGEDRHQPSSETLPGFPGEL